MEQISVIIQYSAKDLQLAYTLDLSRNYPIRSKILLGIGILVIGLSAFLFFLNILSLDPRWWSDVQAWALSLYGLIIIVYHFWKMSGMGKRMFNRMPDFHLPYQVVIDDKGVSTTGASVSSNTLWEHYTKAIVTDKIVLLYTNPFKINIYPEHFFNKEEFNRLKEIVIKRIAQK